MLKDFNNMEILIFLSHYIPGYKSGGPLQSIKNIVEVLGDEINFSIVTLDRDIGDKHPYRNVVPNQWTMVGKARIIYLPPESVTLSKLKNIMRDNDYDTIYLNSVFSFRFSILPTLVFNWIKPRAHLLIAPRGEFSPGALELKALKKTAYIRAANSVNFFKHALFHASTEVEKDDVLSVLGKESRVVVGKDLPDLSVPVIEPIEASKTGGQTLKVCFISRLVPKKNLDYAIQILERCARPLEFTIFGLKEDPNYWAKCEELLGKLPDHVSWSYGGELYPRDVKNTFSNFDIFLFPTRGENYGHVIAESLLSGTFALISDRTPWANLENENIGRVIPLSEMNQFVDEIHAWGRLSASERFERKLQIQQRALSLVIDNDDVEANRALFTSLK
jgi:glycosyltransferase involved in cell wall biosynthesis